MLAVGAISDGMGSVFGGGNFWQGAGQGAITSALNEVVHEVGTRKKSYTEYAKEAFPLIGEQVMEPLDGFWDHFLNIGGREYVHYSESGHRTVYPVGWNGKASLPMNIGMAPLPKIKGAKIFIKGFGNVNKAKYHDFIKPGVLGSAGKYYKYVGDNPDIFIQKGNIMLRGTGGGFVGKTYDTGLNVFDFFY